MRRTLLMVGNWHGASRLGASAVASGWRVLHTLSLDDVPDAMDQLTPHMVVLGGSAAATGLTRRADGDLSYLSRRAPVVTISGDHAQELLTLIVSGSHQRLPEPATKPVSPSSPGIRASVDYIEANYTEDISLADTARMACYSRCHFSKVFKKEVGVGFLEYLNRVRIEHARNLLTTSTLTVTEVALAVGFRDLSHFERVFRRVRRQTPSEYRSSALHRAQRTPQPRTTIAAY